MAPTERVGRKVAMNRMGSTFCLRVRRLDGWLDNVVSLSGRMLSALLTDREADIRRQVTAMFVASKVLTVTLDACCHWSRRTSNQLFVFQF